MARLIKIVLDLGEWNLTTTISKTIQHNLNAEKIRSISGNIISDDGEISTEISAAPNFTDGSLNWFVFITSFTSDKITLSINGGVVSNSNYSGSENRGHLVIEHEL